DFSMRMQARQMAEIQESGRKNAEEGEKFLAANAGKPDVQTTASGLQYQVLSEGSGAKPKAGDTVRVHYKGTLLDGETFDDSYARGEPVEFALAQVVPGWQEGLQLMPVGSKYKLWIPGELGYGEQGTPGGPIGPNATLVFEVELLDIVDGREAGLIPSYEPGLEPMVKANHAAGRLKFTTDAAAAIAASEVIFIAVGTPPDEDGSADLQYVLAVARTIGRHLQAPAIVVGKSTVPVGTADRVREAI